MKKSFLLKPRPHTSKFLTSDNNPFHPFTHSPPNTTNLLITLQNPTNFTQPQHSSYNYEKSDLNTYKSTLQNNNKRGLRSDENFNKFLKVMLNTAKTAKSDLFEAKLQIKEIEKPSKGETFTETTRLEKKNKEQKIMNQKTFEKKIKNLTEKLNNKTTLTKINDVLKEIYDERKKTKKIVKYIDSHKIHDIRPNSIDSHYNIRSSYKRHDASLEDSPQLDILDNNKSFIPKAVNRALNQLKNFIIDVPLIDDENLTAFNQNRNMNQQDGQLKDVNKSYIRKTSRLLPGNQYNNEKHLKEDFRMFKGSYGNKLIRKFTAGADEEAHEKEMSYYLNLIRLKNVGMQPKQEKKEIYDFNDELHRIYKKESLIRSHGRLLKRKFNRLKNEIKDTGKKHIEEKVDKIEAKIHRGLMKDYKVEEKKVIMELVEKMRPLRHKNTL